MQLPPCDTVQSFCAQWWLYFLKETLLHDCHTCVTACLTPLSLPEGWASMHFGLCTSLLCCMVEGALQMALHSSSGKKPPAVCWGCTSALCSSIGQTRQPSAQGAWSPSPQTGFRKARKKDYLCFLHYGQRGFASTFYFLLTWGTAGLWCWFYSFFSSREPSRGLRDGKEQDIEYSLPNYP